MILYSRNLDKGGIVVCGGIHMSDIPSFPYRILWNERTIRSVANLTRKDRNEFLKLAPMVPIKTEIQIFQLHEANEALKSLREGEYPRSSSINDGKKLIGFHYTPTKWPGCN